MSDDHPTLSSDELQLFNALLTARFGFHFPEPKREILESRLRPRLAAHGLRSFLDYYILIASTVNGSHAEELAALVPALTNNETYFFRETAQLDAFFGPGLDHLQSEIGKLESLHLLCAGCSSGEEAYTMRFYLLENQYRLPGCQVSIDAFDLDTDKIRLAREADYRQGSLRAVPKEKIPRYFHELAEGHYRVRPLYRQGVRFFTGNIVDQSFCKVPAAYDAVFCRNVLIYFPEEAMLRAVEHFAFCLRRGGLLFLGHSESIIGKTERFEPIKLGDCIVYRKVC